MRSTDFRKRSGQHRQPNRYRIARYAHPMSIKISSEVWTSSSAKASSRLVLLALADYADDDGYCYPSIARLAVKCVLTERNVQLILRYLEQIGELVTERGAGRGNVNAYWVLPPATLERLRLEGKTVQTFHPLRILEERVKAASETVKEDAEKANPEVQMVKPTSPRTVTNHQEPSTTTTAQKGETRGVGTLEPDQPAPTLVQHQQSSSAARTMLGTADGRARGSAPPASRAWALWLTLNPAPAWLEPDPWLRWLSDLDERGISATAGRLEEQLKRLRELSMGGEPQAQVVARAIASGWINFYPVRVAQTRSTPRPSRSDDRYGRYR